MHLAVLEGAGATLLQGGARVVGVHRRALKPAFDRLIGAWSALGASNLALRMRCDPRKGALAVSVFLTAPQTRAASMRQFFARLALLEGLDGAEVETPADDGAMQALLDDWPALTVALDAAGLSTANGAQLFCRGLWPGLNDAALERLAALGEAIWLHVNIAPMLPDANDQKRWARALIALDGLAGLPADLRASQADGVEAARRASCNIESYWGVESAASGERVIAVLDELARAHEPSAFRQVALHRALPTTPSAVLEAVHAFIGGAHHHERTIAGFASASEAAAAQAWTAAQLPQASPAAAPAEGGQHGVRFEDMPPLSDGPGFAFISYAHADAAAVYNILHRLNQHGVRYWYDRGIPAGEQWDDELERRLSSAAAVLAFVSPRWAGSRYCRRELKYADILGKPIAPIIIAPAALEGGLAFTLSPIQSVAGDDPALIGHLRRFLGSGS